MPEATKSVRRRAKAVSDNGDSAEERADDATEQAEDQAQDGSKTITSELKDTFREAAIEVLKPVMRKATTSAAKYAVKHGPDLVKDKLEGAGGAGALAKGIASKGGGVADAVGGIAGKLGGGGKKKEGESPSGHGRGRRLPVEEFIDVGVDLATAYDQFTQFEDWPEFMHRVERIEQRDEATLMWHENIWGVRRSWEAEITDQTPCERIAWRSKGGTQTIGVVTFHRLSENLTRILMTVDFQPKGLFEKTASGTRISRRAIKSDLMRFKAYIELHDEATGEWRGRIEDGEPIDDERDEVRDDEPRDEDEEDEPRAEDEEDEPRAEDDEDVEAYEEEDYEDEEEPEEPEDEEEEEPEAEEDEEEPRAEEDEEPEEEEEEEPEEKPAPRRRRRKPAAKAKTRSRR